MPIPVAVAKLVDLFERNLPAYKSGKYNETQVRVEFIDPLFMALGWDLHNQQGYAEAYKDVVHEDAIKVGGVTKAPDYSFRIGGVRKFFLEAKKPSVDINNDIHPAYQLRRYAWSAKLPLSVLTDFEEFAVYDCRPKPDPKDGAAIARTIYMRYTDYADRWDEIEAIFSREAILKGSFDKYADSHKAKKGTAEVDHAFLEEIERWRDLLARNIALRNPAISQRELNFAVQQTVDRIIFLRICEDRGIEPYGSLMALQNGAEIYPRLLHLFQLADARYNSGLFHFEAEKGRAGYPDTLTPTLKVDDKTLRDVLHNLYYPESPYEFSVLPADILGQIYEQFLGKVIRLTVGHQAKVEEKPEVKKAGGVYYTPTYIVNYIVKQTVGKVLEGKAAGPRAGVSKLRILDPACGSGSFLIGAYQFLLDWHLQQYIAETPEQWANKRNPQLYKSERGEWRLTIEERKRILLNNIYGVDIDAQAVEVTKLSLLLKVLEGESDQTLNPQMALIREGVERVLPDLAHNIRCGNSLIGPDFYNNQLALFDEEEAYRINVFDWQTAFPETFADGGFDAVIGNPPYIRIQAMKEWAPIEVEFYKQHYTAASKGNYDIYVVFLEKGLSLLNAQGRLGYILPHKFFNAKYGEPVRELIAKGEHLQAVVHFGDQQIFAGATTYTCLLFLNKQPQKHLHFVQAHDLKGWRFEGKQVNGEIASGKVVNAEWNFVIGSNVTLFEKLSKISTKLKDVTDRIFQGIKTSADKIYIVNVLEQIDNQLKIYSPHLETELWVESQLFHTLAKGGDSRAYSLRKTDRVILFPYEADTNGRFGLVNSNKLQSELPLTWSYLSTCKSYLEDREQGRMKGTSWYGYIYPKSLDVIGQPKIFTPDIAPKAAYSLDDTGKTFFTGGTAGGYGILVRSPFSKRYILGVLNSKLLDWYLKQISTSMRGGWYSFESRYIEQLPIRTIDFTNPTDTARHERMVALVQRMLDLHKQLAAATLPHQKSMLQTQIDATDRQINQLVYELYELTEEEIAIVEGES